jgi:endoglucanase
MVTALAAGLMIGLSSTARGAAPALESTPYGNLSKALAQSLYFYDAEKSGPARSLKRQRASPDFRVSRWRILQLISACS